MATSAWRASASPDMVPRIFENKNLARWDRAGRIVLGVTLLSLVWIGPKTHWGWLGILSLISAFAGSCPCYTAAGLSTNKGNKP